MVLVHGGGGRAFREWAEHWARLGYVALAMDLGGHGPDGPLPDGGPNQSDRTKFRDFDETEIRDLWSYHAVAAVIRGHSLMRSLPEVDARRIGVTGISWGGYLTCIVAGLDSRFRVAAPVYGCGFLGDNSVWKDGALASMTPQARQLWLENFDPSQYLEHVRCPILFLNGTTDFAYPLDSYHKSYRLVPEAQRTVCIVKDLPHGHIWNFKEVDVFVESVLNGGIGLPRLGPALVASDAAAATVTSPLPLKDAALYYTADDGPWQKREWHSLPASVDGAQVSAPLPAEAPRALFLAVTDSRGLRASSELHLP
jgi:dienelactone hydrolase